jgi:hypothetical protein
VTEKRVSRVHVLTSDTVTCLSTKTVKECTKFGVRSAHWKVQSVSHIVLNESTRNPTLYKNKC